jgi:hypothetical protein
VGTSLPGSGVWRRKVRTRLSSSWLVKGFSMMVDPPQKFRTNV